MQKYLYSNNYKDISVPMIKLTRELKWRHKVPKMLIYPFFKCEDATIFNNFIAIILLFKKLSFQCKKVVKDGAEIMAYLRSSN
jgi:hypothetical protein